MIAYKNFTVQMLVEGLSYNCEDAVLQSWNEKQQVLIYKVKENYPKLITSGAFITRIVSVCPPERIIHCSCKGRNYQAYNYLCPHIAQVLIQESKTIMALEKDPNFQEVTEQVKANSDEQLLTWASERVEPAGLADQIKANLKFERWYRENRRVEVTEPQWPLVEADAYILNQCLGLNN